MSVGEPVIVQISVELQFGGSGSLYFDSSGRTQRNLLEQLGTPPFVATASASPPIVATGVASPTERLSVEFNDQRLVVQQQFAETIARMEHVAPIAWSEVHDRFELTRRVKRCGARFWLMWAGESESAVEDRLTKAGIFSELPVCHRVFGGPLRKRAFVAVVGDDDNAVRYQLGAGRATVSVEGTAASGDIPDALRKFHIEHGILLDVDASRTFTASGNVTKSDLKNFIRESWRKAAAAAREIGELL